MFPALNIDQSYIPYARHPTRYKKALVYAKIDGQNWYDISEYVKEVKVVNKLEFLETPAIDTATITLANLNNEWTPTQYNDVFDPTAGKFNGTVDQAYLSKEWEVKIYVRVENTEAGTTLDIPLFYGVKTQLVEKHKEAQLKIVDLLYYATKKKLETDILYIDMKPNQILSDLLQRAGYDTSMFDFQDVQYTCTFLARKDKTIWQAVIDLVKGTAGKISASPEGKILYRTRMDANSYADPDPALSLDQETFKRYDLNTERKYNKITIESEGFRVDSSTSNVIDVQLEGEDRVIEAGKTGTFELEYISDYAMDVSDTIILSYETGYINVDGNFVGTGVHEGISFTVSDSNPQPSNEHIQIIRYEKYAEKVVLEIKNLLSDGAVAIDHVTISGKQVKKVNMNKVVRENTTDEPDKEYSTKSFFDSQAVLETIADVMYDDINKTVRFGLAMNEFYPDVFAGNLIEFSVPLKGIASGTFLILKVEHRLQPVRYQTSFDIVEWKGLNYVVGTKVFKIIRNSGSWRDSIPPATPAFTIVQSKFQKIFLVWTKNTEEDFKEYELQWAQDSSFSTDVGSTTLAANSYVFVGEPAQTYYFRVRAIDENGNASDWSEIVSAATSKIQPLDIDDGAIGTIHLQDRAITNSKISDDSVGENHLQDGAVSTSKLQDKSVTLDKQAVKPALPLPEGAIAYWTNSLVDEINGITPEGYTEINLHPSITLTPENAPEGSVVADLLAGNTIYASRRIEVGEGSNRWAIDGTFGLVRVINDQDNSLLAMIYSGLVQITDTNGGIVTVTLPQKLTCYTVVLIPSDFRFWQSGMSTDVDWYLHLSYEDASTDTETKFTITARVTTPSTTTETDLDVQLGDSYKTIHTFTGNKVEELRFYNSWLDVTRYESHTYSSVDAYTIQAKMKYVQINAIIWEHYIVIDWGDGNVTEKYIGSFSGSNPFTAVYIRTSSSETHPALGTVQYIVLGY